MSEYDPGYDPMDSDPSLNDSASLRADLAIARERIETLEQQLEVCKEELVAETLNNSGTPFHTPCDRHKDVLVHIIKNAPDNECFGCYMEAFRADVIAQWEKYFGAVNPADVHKEMEDCWQECQRLREALEAIAQGAVLDSTGNCSPLLDDYCAYAAIILENEKWPHGTAKWL